MQKARRLRPSLVRQHVRAFLAILLMCALVSASAADAQVVAVREGRHVVVADSAALAAKLVALAESCSVNSAAYANPGETWASVASSRSYVRVVFPKHRKALLVRSPGQRPSEQPVREIRLPLPHGDWPAHVFVRVGNGVIALTKYDPFVLKELVLLPELELATTAPYKTLVDLKR